MSKTPEAESQYTLIKNPIRQAETKTTTVTIIAVVEALELLDVAFVILDRMLVVILLRFIYIY
jgi:hypothetical protein